MEKLIFDDGVIRLNVNGNGILAFNPSDFNLYERFYSFSDEVLKIEKEYAEIEDSQDDSDMERLGKGLNRMAEIDAKVKEKLNHVFGGENDFSKIFGGINLMSFGINGERIITNFLNAITPYIERGVANYTGKEVEAVKANREQRRAAQRKAKG
jgi:hypothetical protein